MPAKKPVVSIILPTFNRAYCLGRTITSVLAQSYEDWELIIIDNHSTDSTDNLIANYKDPRISVVKINNDGVIAKSRNRGLAEARGVYVAFLDSDDWWADNKLYLSVQAMQQGADLIYSDAIMVRQGPRGTTQKKIIRCRQLNSPVFIDLFHGGNCIVCSSVVVRKKLLDKIEGFSEDKNLIAAEDYDAWLRLSKFSEKFTVLNKSLVYYSWGQGNTSSDDKTISYCIRLAELYNENCNKQNGKFPRWLNYSLAVAYYRNKMYAESLKLGKNVILFSIRASPRSLEFITKSIYIIIASWLKRYTTTDNSLDG